MTGALPTSTFDAIPTISADPIATGSAPANPTPANPVTSGSQASTMEALMTLFLQNQQAQQALQQSQQALLERLAPASTPAPRKTDYEKPPLYNVAKLKRGVTEAVLQDWIAAVKTGDATRQHCAQDNRIVWAMTVLDEDLQSDWRTHQRSLQSQGKPVTMEALYTFVKGEHLNPKAHTNRVRKELRDLVQGDTESPESLYTRWCDLHQQLGHKNYTTDEEAIWGLTQCFNEQLQEKLESLGQHEPLATAWETITQAQERWDMMIKWDIKPEAKRPAPEPAELPFSKKPRVDKPVESYQRPEYPTTNLPANSKPQDHSRPQSQSQPKFIPPSNMSPTACWNCGEEGHIRRRCPKLLKPPTPTQVALNIPTTRQQKTALIQELLAYVQRLQSDNSDE